MNFLRATTRLAASPSNFLLTRRTALPATSFAVRHLSDSTRKSIEDVLSKNKLVVFMKGYPRQPMCGFSRAVMQIMEVQGVDLDTLKTFNILEDEELRSGMKEFSSWPTFPQVYIGGEFVGGCDIMVNMHQSGELEDLLVKEGIVEPEPQENPRASS
ncbi:monothiol glutaredoxin grx5 [Actinomortierella ambigua]|uniref:Monothiol glutaredoxin-5, mitochondrial n=1 Tax=Actinomortierella ambigua TaxID=1343610 RepID=A0A9P6QDP1_9FUNG|nr:monothiol glutaredoxin grx5 [Actinomortierella ambigua]